MAPFGQSRMLPREAYVDQAVFDWEQQHIFSGWTCVGHAADLAAVGAQKAVGTGANAILLVRGDDDTVRAFANTCRHRGHELLACNATTKGRSIVCPYHSWSYRLDGSLRNAPHFSKVEGFDADQFGLAELELVNWHGWLFVDPSGEDVDFADHVAGWEDIVAPYRPEDLTVVDRHSYELATNWKVIAENYQECYHCSTIHPELSRISPPTSGENLDTEGSWIGGWTSRNHSVGISFPRPISRAFLRTTDPSAANCVPAPVLLLNNVISSTRVRPGTLPARRSWISWMESHDLIPFSAASQISGDLSSFATSLECTI